MQVRGNMERILQCTTGKKVWLNFFCWNATLYWKGDLAMPSETKVYAKVRLLCFPIIRKILGYFDRLTKLTFRQISCSWWSLSEKLLHNTQFWRKWVDADGMKFKVARIIRIILDYTLRKCTQIFRYFIFEIMQGKNWDFIFFSKGNV